MEQTIETRLDRLESRIALENLVGSYLHLRLAGRGCQIVEQLWADRSDASLEYGASGKYVGLEHLASFYQKDILPGKFVLLYAIAPVIEVAGDGQSARGIWLGLGTETDAGELNPDFMPEEDPERAMVLSTVTESGQRYTADWVFQKYAFDFIRIDRGWRILHLHVYEITRCPFNQDWVRYAQQRFDTDGMRLDALFKSNLPLDQRPAENMANEATRYYWQYTTDSLTELVPNLPAPYQTLVDLPEL